MSLVESNQSKPGLLCNPEGSQRTLYPYVTGTSVVALKYKDGILMAAERDHACAWACKEEEIDRFTARQCAKLNNFP